MADHFTPVSSVSYRETERQRQHTEAGRTGNPLHYVPDEFSDDTPDAADADTFDADDGDEAGNG